MGIISLFGKEFFSLFGAESLCEQESESLTVRFLRDFKEFMKDVAILIPLNTQPRKGDFQLEPQGSHAAVVKVANSGTVISGFNVHPFPNKNNEYALPTQLSQPYYMLTAQLDGCQFIAYGPDRQHVTVEHNNFIDNRGDYALRLSQIKQQAPEYLFHITASDRDQFVGDDKTYDLLQVINVVGRYTLDEGWQFWVRNCAVQDDGEVYGPF